MQAKKQKIIGDNLPNGLFRLHSSFKKVLNYHNSNDLISVVLPEIGASAIAIVVDEIPFNVPSEVIIDDEQIILGNEVINKRECQIYNSIPKLAFLPQDIDSFIAIAKPEIVKSGLSFLINQEKEASCGFLQNFIKKMQNAVDIFFKNPVAGALKIKGLGFGLTPTGDDFLCGAISALWIINQIEKRQMDLLIEQIYEASLGQNLLSNSFLKQAKNGHFFYQFKELIESLFNNNKKSFKLRAEALANIGDSSGSAMLCGLLLSLKSFNLPNKI